MNTAIIVVLILAAICLMLIEVFLIPGFGFAGVASLASLAGAVAWAYLKSGPLAGHITLLVSLVLMGISIYAFLRGRALEKMSLKTDISDKVDLLEGLSVAPGDVVKTSSRLAPMGKVRVGGRELEAKSSAFVEPETDVEIVRIEGNILVVKPI